jgi:hypothetical protein
MRISTRTALVTTLSGLLALSGCAGTDGPGGPSSTPAASASPPSIEQLSAALLTPDDLTGHWTADSGAPEGGEQIRLVTYDLQCSAAADALAAAERIEVDASTSLRAQEVPGEVFVVEYLIADEPDTIAQAFTTLRDGVTACIGKEEGPEGSEPVLTSAYAIPEVGADRFAVSTLATSGEGAPTMHTAYVRKGPVLLVVHTGADDTTQLDDAAIAEILTSAVAKLP